MDQNLQRSLGASAPSRWAIPRLVVILVAIAGLGACGASAPQPLATATPGGSQPTSTTGCHYRGQDPDPTCTPGATSASVTQANIHSTICRSGYTASVRPPVSYTEPLKRELLAAYGDQVAAAAYELDHLVPLELGGAPRSRQNLWPQPWERDRQHPAGFAPPGQGAQSKDRLENELRRRVCAGAMPLAEAQGAIAADWRGLAVRYGQAA